MRHRLSTPCGGWPTSLRYCLPSFVGVNVIRPRCRTADAGRAPAGGSTTACSCRATRCNRDRRSHYRPQTTVRNGTQPSGLYPTNASETMTSTVRHTPRKYRTSRNRRGTTTWRTSRKLTRPWVCSDGNRGHRQAPVTATPKLGLRFARAERVQRGCPSPVPRRRPTGAHVWSTSPGRRSAACARSVTRGAVDGGGACVAAGASRRRRGRG